MEVKLLLDTFFEQRGFNPFLELLDLGNPNKQTISLASSLKYVHHVNF